MDYQSLVSIVPWNFVTQILNLLLQAYLFKRFLFKPVKKIMAERQAQVNRIYDEAAEKQASADADKQTYEKLLQDAKIEAAELVRSASVTAQSRGDEILRLAKAEASGIKEKASNDIALERKKVMGEVKDDIAGIAMEIASKVVEREIDARDHQALVEEFIEKMGEPS